MHLQQCENFENLLRFRKVSESLKVGTFLRHSCSLVYRIEPRTKPNEQARNEKRVTLGEKVTPVCLWWEIYGGKI